MRKSVFIVALLALGWLTACSSTAPTPRDTNATPAPYSTVVLPSGYRPLQQGDAVEGVTIGYQFILPSYEQPIAVIAASPYLLHFVSIKPALRDGLIAYIREFPQNKTVLAFDETDPNQNAPKPMTWNTNQPVEIALIPLPEGKHVWSVTEEDENGLQAAYKIVRRKDGGLRFIDAYGKAATFSAAGLNTTNGTGMGLMFSARLALLRMILSDSRYQVGKNVMQDHLPDYSQYDPRILKLDPSKEGIAMNRDWVLVTIPGPNSGMAAP
ncbi:MAG: hypothetical protein HY868_12595 [Chloroflexi bacterium]|nr:hypothetical protein [Chloroflexota bacterium]